MTDNYRLEPETETINCRISLSKIVTIYIKFNGNRIKKQSRNFGPEGRWRCKNEWTLVQKLALGQVQTRQPSNGKDSANAKKRQPIIVIAYFLFLRFSRVWITPFSLVWNTQNTRKICGKISKGMMKVRKNRK